MKQFSTWKHSLLSPMIAHAVLALGLLVAVPAVRADSVETVELHAQLSQANQTRRQAKWKRIYHWSLAALASGVAHDSASSWQKFEANPLLCDRYGRFSHRGLTIKAGLAAGSAVTGYLIVRKYPYGARAAAITNFAAAGMLHSVAAHNWRMPK